MLAISTAFTIWRLVVRFRMSQMSWSDWLMLLGTIMNDAGISLAITCGFAGTGRLLRDPFWNIERMVYNNHLTFASQLLNVYGMFVVKLSICAYLLALNFSKRYRKVIWGTVAFVTVFNFLLPVTQHFGLCRPLASRWDITIVAPIKQCWPQIVRIGIAYTQAISNIVTDLVYATAPIAYLQSIQLSRQTQWSVRAVFLMSLVCTTISALKLWSFQLLQDQTETYYESVSLSIWSTTEVSIGIVVANLPPLRKSFDGMFKHILPAAIFSGKQSSSRLKSFNLPTYGSQSARRSKIEGRSGRSERLPSIADNASERAILEDIENQDGAKSSSGIMRTTQLMVSNDPADKIPTERH
ncbi:hypothetical protein P153DRAFT_294851 [Dothidotthia symphoricarpi CBS 119687]|uniref:Rhodopsin domain-containing protein n=1 Tax=Dothidotthia symphoricarpi CBS 119687 TaxID=1392245 RepID=A0A6A6AAU1_9PLEO|nr:uncharacterized protein P153DRAFT_294851 [Dothidotthia symphoricarpi CBS 119687]KAF2127821.1 hypothetical protein P153DRAFT_294851 [Dothidotthia symphoricarpi CBS 119687]